MTGPPDFRTALEAQTEAILFDYVGQGGGYSDPDNYIVQFLNYIPRFDAESDSPICVIIATDTNQKNGGSGAQHEYGTARELWTWLVDIYYLDVELGDEIADYNTGRARQNDIVNRMRNALENEPRMRGLSVQINPTGPSGAFNEYVYDNDWQSVSFDQSGQPGYWAFVSVMKLVVQTARN